MKREREGDYESLIRIVGRDRGQDARRRRHACSPDGKPRIVEIKGIDMDAEFAPHMLYVTNEDKPGFIGRFGTLLGEAGINIATFNLGRDEPGGDADLPRRRRRGGLRRAAARHREDPAGQAGAPAEVLISRRAADLCPLPARLPRRPQRRRVSASAMPPKTSASAAAW